MIVGYKINKTCPTFYAVCVVFILFLVHIPNHILLFAENVRDVVERTQGTTTVPTITESQAAMRQAFRERIRYISRTRAANSDDYDPSQCATVERFLAPK